MTSIRSPDTNEQADVDRRIIERTNAIFNIGFVQEMSAQERAQVIDEYRRALRHNRLWVIEKAFDNAAREIPRRPTHAELVIIADRVKRPIADEIARRKRIEAENQEAASFTRRNRVSPEAAARIMAEYGMTAERLAAVHMRPMSSDIDADMQAEASVPLRDWTEGLDDQDPRLVLLRKSRAESTSFGGAA
jgi:hypothetical protein